MSAEVVQLNNSSEVYDQIQNYLIKKAIKSRIGNESIEKTVKNSGTRRGYEKDIKNFFMRTRNKDIQFLTREDIQITLDDFENFVFDMIDDKYAAGTINRNVVSVKGLLTYLHAKKIVKDISYFSEIDRQKDTKRSYDPLMVDEVMTMANLALQERNKSLIKHWLLIFSMDTSLRINEVLNVKWTDFEDDGEDMVFEGIGKGGKPFKKKISKSFYEELKVLDTGESEKVFNISTKAVNQMFKRLLEKMTNISKDRRIVFHSVRKCGITFHWRATRDVLSTMRVGNHSNFQTTTNYIEDDDYGAIGAYSSRQNLDKELYQKVDKELLINVIDEMKDDFKILLSMKLKKKLDDLKTN